MPRRYVSVKEKRKLNYERARSLAVSCVVARQSLNHIGNALLCGFETEALREAYLKLDSWLKLADTELLKREVHASR